MHRIYLFGITVVGRWRWLVVLLFVIAGHFNAREDTGSLEGIGLSRCVTDVVDCGLDGSVNNHGWSGL